MGGCEIFNLTNQHGKRRIVKNPSYELSPYLFSFMYGMTYRYSCYDCKFAKIPRQGDITLADYWGVKKFFPNLDVKYGVSLLLCNTVKGNSIINDIDGIILEKSNVSDASQFNSNLIKVSAMHSLRDGIYTKIREEGYAIVAKKYFRSPNYYKRCLTYRLLQYRFFSSLVNKIFK